MTNQEKQLYNSEFDKRMNAMKQICLNLQTSNEIAGEKNYEFLKVILDEYTKKYSDWDEEEQTI